MAQHCMKSTAAGSNSVLLVSQGPAGSKALCWHLIAHIKSEAVPPQT